MSRCGKQTHCIRRDTASPLKILNRKENKHNMIGFYDYTLILTLLSLISSVFGITQAIDGRFKLSIICLAFSGLCDAFDGKVARTKKNRTDDECSFGIQLDSLCDMVAFGAFPAVICYLLGVRGYIGCIAISYYCICSVIRLSYYNVVELNRMNMDEPSEKVYYGLPITSITIILPAVFLLELVVPEQVFPALLIAMLFAVGTCFILNFKIYRPGKLVLVGLIVLTAVAVFTILVFSDYNIAALRHSDAMRSMIEALHALS